MPLGTGPSDMPTEPVPNGSCPLSPLLTRGAPKSVWASGRLALNAWSGVRETYLSLGTWATSSMFVEVM